MAHFPHTSAPSASSREIIQDGYAQYEPSKSIFKIPLLNSWQIIVTSPEHITDIRRAKDEDLDLSLVEAQNDTLGLEWTVGWERGNLSDYHVRVLLKMLISNFAPNCSELHDEVVESLNTVLPLCDKEWASILPYPNAEILIAHVSNRLYVGHPLCQDLEYIKLVITHSENVPPAGMFIKSTCASRYIGPIVSPLARNTRRANDVFGAYLAERIRLFREYGKEWDDKPPRLPLLP